MKKQFSEEWCVQAASEINRLAKADTYHRDTIRKLNAYIEEQEGVIDRLREMMKQADTSLCQYCRSDFSAGD